MALFTAQDIRFAFRNLQTRPGLSAVIIATLGLGIGATTATFSLLDATLLRPLPFERADRLVFLWGVYGPERSQRGASPPEVTDWRTQNHTLTGVSAYDPISLNLRTENGPDRLNAERVNPEYFRLLGVTASQGRTFTAEEDRVADAFPVVVVSHNAWRTRFGGDTALVGRSITLNDRRFTVVGIMPEGFSGLSFQADLWIPLAMVTVDSPAGLLTSRNNRWLLAVARLKDGVSIADAERDLGQVALRLAEQYPEINTDRSVDVLSLQENLLGNTASLFQTLFKAVLLVLLIACANVMSLQLVRATAREREIALRGALGAGRLQLVRQLLSEGLVLAGLGGAAGVLLAYWLIRLLVPLVPAGLIPLYADVTVNPRVLGFTLALTVLTGIACGLAPLLRRGSADLSDALRQGVRTASSGLGRLRRPGLQQALVAGEVALALILLAGAGLMLRSLALRLAVDPGFEAAGVVAARVSLPRPQYQDFPARADFVDRLVTRLGALPGVARAAIASDLPLRGNTNASTLLIEGPTPVQTRYFRHSVTPGYFAALGIPLTRGRDFSGLDRQDTQPVAIISEAMAARFWPDRDPVGMRFRQGGETGAETIVIGVAGPARQRNLTTDLFAAGSEPDVYYPFAQRTATDLEIAVRMRDGSLLSTPLLQREVAALDPGLPLFQVASLESVLAAQNSAPRFGSLVLSGFSAVALVLAAIGIYGVIAFVVGLSRREIAIRLALGANQGQVLRVVMGNGMLLVLAGLGLGVLGALAGGRVIQAQLYGVTPGDPVILIAVSGAVVLVALLASWLPARRAALVDPQAVLKGE
jgi:putative ABC transport system permease protein